MSQSRSEAPQIEKDSPNSHVAHSTWHNLAASAYSGANLVEKSVQYALVKEAKEIANSPPKSLAMEMIDFGAGAALTAVTHNRYEGLIAKRALAIGFSTAIAGDMFSGDNLKHAWAAVKDTAHNPSNVAQDSALFEKAVVRTISDGLLNSASTYAGQHFGKRFSLIDNLLTTTTRESFLRTGTLEKDVEARLPSQYVTKEFEKGGMSLGHVISDDTSQSVISRNMNARKNYPLRFRNEVAMDKLHGLIGFDTDSAENAIRVETGGGKKRTLWVQETRGRDLFEHLETHTGLHLSDRGANGIYAMHIASEAPHLKEQLGKTLLERILAGEADNHPGNIIVRETVDGAKTSNIDADFAFRTNMVPNWGLPHATDDIKSIYKGQAVPAEDLQKLHSFVEKFDTPKGRAELGTLNLNKKEVDAYLARVKWVVEHGIFPEE